MAGRPADLEKKISDCAYFLWEKAGRPDYREKEFWNIAEYSITKIEIMDENDSPGAEQYLSKGSQNKQRLMPTLARRAVVLTKAIRGYPEQLRRKHQRTRVRTALRLARPKLNEWRASEFIDSPERKRYSLQFLHVMRPIISNEIVKRHWRKLYLNISFVCMLSYFIVLPFAIPEQLNHLMSYLSPQWQGTAPPKVIFTLVVSHTAKSMALLALGEVLFFMVAGMALLISKIIGIRKDTIKSLTFFSLTVVTILSLVVVLAMYFEDLQNASLYYASIYIICLTILGFAGILMGFLRVLAGALVVLSKTSEARHPASHAIDNLFRAMRRLQKAGTNWADTDTRTYATAEIAVASEIVRRSLLQRFATLDAKTLSWRHTQAEKISAALSEKQTWLMTPKPDTRDELFKSIGQILLAFISDVWDTLELAKVLATETSTSEIEEKQSRQRAIHVVLDSMRTLLVALLPAILFLLADKLDLLSDIGEPGRGYIKIGLFVWAALTVILLLDPLFKEKFGIIKEAYQLVKPSGKKAE